jgi:predicted AAA+ superfamily ATPase
VGGLHRSHGELIETLVAARRWEKFSGYPYNFSQGHQRGGIHDEKGVRRTEVDIMLTDGEWAMAVEVKREPDEKDVDYHLKRMELVRKYPPAVAKGKKLLGAMAGGVVSPDVRQYAHQAGLFVLELNGDNVALVPPPDGFSPEVWGLGE